MRRKAIVAILYSLFTIHTSLFVACEGKVSPSLSGLNPQELPSQESWGTQVVFSDSGTDPGGAPRGACAHRR